MSTAGEVIKCKAAVAWSRNVVEVETVEVAPPQKGEVRVKIQASGICHTDISSLDGIDFGYPDAHFPVILGHEGAGVVESVGEGVTGFKPGDAVMSCPLPYCGECRPCKSSDTRACLTMFDNIPGGYIGYGDDKAIRFTCKGKPVFHYLGISSFSQYAVCRDVSLVKVKKEAVPEKIVPISCGIVTGHGAAVYSAAVKKGSSCAVWGLGTVGLAAVMGCKHQGASCIIAIDTNPEKFKIAKKVGATHCLNPDDADFDEALMKATGGHGTDFAIECVGNNSVLRKAVETTNKFWGKTVVVGVTPGELTLTDSLQFIFGRKLIGSWVGGKFVDSTSHVPELVDLYLDGQLPVEEVISHNISLDNINDGIELMKTRKCVKIVIQMF